MCVCVCACLRARARVCNLAVLGHRVCLVLNPAVFVLLKSCFVFSALRMDEDTACGAEGHAETSQ